MDKEITPDNPLYAAYRIAADQRRLLGAEPITDRIVADLYNYTQKIAKNCVCKQTNVKNRWQTRLDDICTSRITGYPIMLLLLCAIFWLTISGANVPSELLATVLFSFQDQLTAWFTMLNAPDWLHGLLVLGMYRSLAWVVSVMLPPMAIFFPLFTLLEDFGYLPRVAFNLDCAFKRCRASGKQVLSMRAVSCLDAIKCKKLFATTYYIDL